jgi:hypothetical protein
MQQNYVRIRKPCDSHEIEHRTSGISFANSYERVSQSSVRRLSLREAAASSVCPLVQASIADERLPTSMPVFRRLGRDVSGVVAGQ